MRLFRWSLMFIVVVMLGMAMYLIWQNVWGRSTESPVKPLQGDDQEIAFIEPAINTDDWSRLVTGIKLLKQNWTNINPTLPILQIWLGDAFPALTAEVPEVVLSLSDNANQRLRLRWYKISGEHDAASWVKKLSERARPPLCIIGGGSSDRAKKLAEVLQKTYPNPAQRSPVFLITFATAEKADELTPLIDVYKQRSFRFSFTNQKMVESLLQFVQYRDTTDQAWARELWVHRPSDTEGLQSAVASMVATGNPWHSCAVLHALPYLQPYTMHAIYWQDERYSKDLYDLFEQGFKEHFPLGKFFDDDRIISPSVGKYYQPAPYEQSAVDNFIIQRQAIAPYSFLVLPTQTGRMRRFLMHLRDRSPLHARNLVVLNGDAISFNSVYRDREVAWNIFDVPYSLLFFSHRNPIDASAGFTWARDERIDATNTFPQPSSTGTHDYLLFRDLIEAILYAAYDHGQLLGDSRELRKRLYATRWYLPPRANVAEDPARVRNLLVHGEEPEQRPFFKKGNRESYTGEHIVWVKPIFDEASDRLEVRSKISVWTVRADQNGGAWHLVDAWGADYNLLPAQERAP